MSSLHLHGIFKGNWFWLQLFQFLLLTASESVAFYTNGKESIKTANDRQAPWYIPLKKLISTASVALFNSNGRIVISCVTATHLSSFQVHLSLAVYSTDFWSQIYPITTQVYFLLFFSATWYALISANALFDWIIPLYSFSWTCFINKSFSNLYWLSIRNIVLTLWTLGDVLRA